MGKSLQVKLRISPVRHPELFKAIQDAPEGGITATLIKLAEKGLEKENAPVAAPGMMPIYPYPVQLPQASPSVESGVGSSDLQPKNTVASGLAKSLKSNLKKSMSV